MIKILKNLWKSVLGLFSLSGLIKWLNSHIGAKRKTNEDAALPPEEESVASAEALPAKPMLVLEKALVLVECVSCGTIHELYAICFNCQQPICPDDFCNMSKYNENVDTKVVYCRSCAESS